MSSPVAVSFEFFPPSDEAGAAQLWAAIGRLAPLRPRFVSVTCGADGTTRDRTQACVLRILRDTELTVAPHLTCVGSSREHIRALAHEYWRHGVRHLLALRGDAPSGRRSSPSDFAADAEFAYAADLVAGLKSTAHFEISVAAYPEGHPETGTVEADLENLKRKIDAGAGGAITQFFFDNDRFLRYRDRCAASGIRANIVPGILPIVRFSQLVRFAGRCGACLPEWLHRRFEGLDHDAETHRLIAAHVAIEQVQYLRRHGVEEFHFYTLNRAELTYAACHALGLKAIAPARASLGECAA
jgi:methylenetetrahydrofolate reductase (NADPH)